ncbi:MULTISPECIES: hypothetical protein [Deinococcus]|jgi:hypothetical protein|nr:hypothetical protein [Deinococcus radiodurans]ANC72036.1 hypothetical protein A2G07_09775 [Deinococcus radiodurans R1 = ATCC 13939 = DSM 20539]QIP28885.1 hypothetical protein HAV23_06640 [Deinococcus radiodurans]QIP32408.1 hypothetical protein HAV35_10150 [Deinococcus radiodurans]UID69744.1 hypothetical protein DRO_0742 [Deinococcus radiodurans R1 = ATCC 13939 = DSM 20539]UTA50311.1 hypothetical protein MSS93_11235 [Deinococcus radiodurans]
MSRAFVKEDGGERWTPPAKAADYRVVFETLDGPETVYEADDLLGALRWAAARPGAGFEVRGRDGRLLAVS